MDLFRICVLSFLMWLSIYNRQVAAVKLGTFARQTGYRQAMKYLLKYGYLECSPSNLMYWPEAATSKSECTTSDIQQAILKLQSMLKIRRSGELDATTMYTMKLGRCGDKDMGKRPPVSRLSQRRLSKLSRIIASRQLAIQEATTSLPAGEASIPDSANQVTSDASAADVPDLPSNLLSDESGKSADAKLTNENGDFIPDDDDDDDSSTRIRRDSIKLMTAGVSLVPSGGRRYRSRMMAIAPVESIVEEDPDVTLKRMRKKIAEELKHRDEARRRVKRNIFQDLVEAHKRRLLRKRVKRSPLALTSGSYIVTWRLPKEYVSKRIPENITKTELYLAFRIWGRFIPLVFREDNRIDSLDIDIELQFGTKAHGCNMPFDGHGGELAHSQSNEHEEIHFDDDEFYQADPDSVNNDDINLLMVATHEIGHVLGLDHSSDPDSVMHPIYHNPGQSGLNAMKLSDLDRQNVQRIHGVCKGRFDAVFDWLEVKYDGDPEVTAPTYLYSTYFYRRDHFWKYENRYNRTLPDHPKRISDQWPGLPNGIDTIVQIPYRCTDGTMVIDIKTYIFKGEYFYLYDEAKDAVARGYPKRISDWFGPKDAASVSVPSNLDATYYDSQMNEVYFFKGEWVWIYDACLIEQNACCTKSRQPFSRHFIMAEGSAKSVTGDIDSVYYSYSKVRSFIFQGEDVYQMEPISYRKWRLLYIGARHEIWRDICDVT